MPSANLNNNICLVLSICASFKKLPDGRPIPLRLIASSTQTNHSLSEDL